MRRRFVWILAAGLILGLSAPTKAQVIVSFGGGGPYRGFGLSVGQPYGGIYPGYGYGSGFYGGGFAPYRPIYYPPYAYGYPRSFSYGSAYYAPGYSYRSYNYGPYYGGRGYGGGYRGPGWGGYRRW